MWMQIKILKSLNQPLTQTINNVVFKEGDLVLFSWNPILNQNSACFEYESKLHAIDGLLHAKITSKFGISIYVDIRKIYPDIKIIKKEG